MRQPSDRKTKGRVVLATRDTSTRRSLARLLLSDEIDVLTAQDADTALQFLSGDGADVLVADLDLGSMSGDVLLHVAKEKYPQVARVLMIEQQFIELGAAAVADDVYDILMRPWALDEVAILTVRRAVQFVRTRDELVGCKRRGVLRQAPPELVGQGAGMKQVHKMIEIASEASLGVHLVGEQGSGRQHCARVIHARSRWGDGPFVYAGVPQGRRLGSEELFGGDGWLSRARGGALYLDGLDGVDLSLQQELAEQLASQMDRPEHEHVRLFVGSTKTLAELTRSGEVHPRLKSEIHNLVVHMPPLRSRRDDIPVLAHVLAKRAATKLERPFERIGVEALRLLRDQDWPGNVAQLEDAMAQAVVWMHGPVMKPADLRDMGLRVGARRTDTLGEPEGVFFKPFPEAKKQIIEKFERRYVENVLERAGGVISEAARLAGLDRSNFRRLQRRITKS